jgi:HD-GYP domain-containing protein (c-di-GMP phosphodiesterase class II)
VAEEISRHWLALGAHIAWMQRGEPWSQSLPADSVYHPAMEEALSRTVLCGRATPFFSDGVAGLAVPMLAMDRCVGAMACVIPAELSDRAEALLGLFCDQLGRQQAMGQSEREIASLAENLTQSYEELDLIHKLGRHLRVADTPNEYFQRYSEDLLELIHARTLVVFVQPSDGGEVTVFFAGDRPVSEIRLESIARYLVNHSQDYFGPLLLNDLNEHPVLAKLLDGPQHSMLAIPLRTSQSVFGTIVAIDRTDGDAFGSVDAKLVTTITEQTASFLHNRFLIDDLNGLLIAVLTSLVNAIDAKDPYTSGHSQRVAALSWRIAVELGVPSRQATEMYLAGLLHDIGKIGVNDGVLLKPGRLTGDEFTRVKQHPLIGAKIITGIKQLQNIIPGVLCHHERQDGSGYPYGLVGDEIPLMGAVVAIADCFDAMTSTRTYRRAMAATEVLREIADPACGLFSPQVVQALLRCRPDERAEELTHSVPFPDFTSQLLAEHWFTNS